MDCDLGVDFYHFQMCGTDKQLCTVRDSFRKSLENKSLPVSFVAVDAPMGPSSSEVVCAGGPAGGEGLLTHLLGIFQSLECSLDCLCL